jgi:hypothetical protein
MDSPALDAAVASLLLAMIATTAQAANIEVTVFARNQLARVTVQGSLLAGDGDKFQEKTNSLREAMVVFQSDGGAVFEGIKIGRIIRQKDFATLVAGRCASACAVAWLGGTHRYMATGAQIGFHAAYDAQSRQQTGYANALVGGYLRELGLSDGAIAYITVAAPNEMAWLTTDTARLYGIDMTIVAASALPPPLPPLDPATLPASGFVVQLSAAKSEAEARASFDAFQARYPALKGQPVLFRRRDVGNMTGSGGLRGSFYAVQVGPFATRDEANQLCESFKSAGGTCFVQYN